jgi:hypothetical protein
VEQVLPEEVGTSEGEGGEDMGKGCGRVTVVQILCMCTRVCKWKNDTR